MHTNFQSQRLEQASGWNVTGIDIINSTRIKSRVQEFSIRLADRLTFPVIRGHSISPTPMSNGCLLTNAWYYPASCEYSQVAV